MQKTEQTPKRFFGTNKNYQTYQLEVCAPSGQEPLIYVKINHLT